MRTTGRRVVPRRLFWYTGEVYTHLRRNGEVGSSGLFGAPEWHRMDVVDFAAALRSCGANRSWDSYRGRVQRVRTTVDHLEVFLPAGGGKLIGSSAAPNRRLEPGPEAHVGHRRGRRRPSHHPEP